MKNIVLTLIIFLVTTFYLNAQQAEQIDVNKAVQMTLQNHPSIKQAEKLVDVSEARIKQQNTTYSPNIDAILSYVRIGPVPTFDLPGGITLPVVPANNYDAHLGLQHTLYDFGKRDAQSELVSSYRTTTRDNIEVIKSNLAFQTIQVFYSILFLKQSLDVKDEQINNLNSHLQITQAKIQSGTATDFDYSTTQVRLASVQNQRIDIENEIRKQEVNLRSLMGLPAGSPLNLNGTLNFAPITMNPDSLFNIARSQRSELKLAKDAEVSADKQKLTAHLSDMPNLGVGVTYGVKNGLEPNIDVLRGNWTAGVQFRYPIYNGKRAQTLEEEAEANLQSAQAHTSDVDLTIRTEISRAVSDVNAAQNQITTAGVQVEHAQRALQRAELQYRDGIISNLDLLDAQTGLAEAKLSQLQIIYKNIISDYLLKKAVGDKVW